MIAWACVSGVAHPFWRQFLDLPSTNRNPTLAIYNFRGVWPKLSVQFSMQSGCEQSDCAETHIKTDPLWYSPSPKLDSILIGASTAFLYIYSTACNLLKNRYQTLLASYARTACKDMPLSFVNLERMFIQWHTKPSVETRHFTERNSIFNSTTLPSSPNHIMDTHLAESVGYVGSRVAGLCILSSKLRLQKTASIEAENVLPHFLRATLRLSHMHLAEEACGNKQRRIMSMTGNPYKSYLYESQADSSPWATKLED